MTIENIGGGHKKRYRIIDFKRNKFGVPAKVASIEYDPNRTANIALLHYVDGEKRYMIAPDSLVVGTEVMSGKDAPTIDYKNIKLLKKYISETGRILPSRVTSVSLKKQKEVS